jgi:lysozyme family protein
MRRDNRQHLAAGIKEVNQRDTIKKEKERTWQQCHICEDWLFEETYFKTEWYTGPAEYSPYHVGMSYDMPTYLICNACCHTAEDVVDYLTELTEKNSESFDKSLKAWQKAEKKKEKEAMCIVDGKNYSFTFKENK